uniref:Uncharacterized protein n=1 Tax=Manihot esculenta TaxID=3983 RepID=A0A2C9VWM0_MANES
MKRAEIQGHNPFEKRRRFCEGFGDLHTLSSDGLSEKVTNHPDSLTDSLSLSLCIILVLSSLVLDSAQNPPPLNLAAAPESVILRRCVKESPSQKHMNFHQLLRCGAFPSSQQLFTYYNIIPTTNLPCLLNFDK